MSTPPAYAAALVPPPAADDAVDGSTFIVEPDDRVVRPVLAVLFRLAVGPSADRYVRRFLAFERAGRASAGWHWPSLIAPSLWAFYRKLWLPGIAFAMLRLGALGAFLKLAPTFGDSMLFWCAEAFLFVIVLPSVLCAGLADWLLYRRVRRLVRRAESQSRSASQAAQWLHACKPTSETAAVLLTFAALCSGVAMLGPAATATYTEHLVRLKVADTLSAVRWVQQQVEEGWASGHLRAPAVVVAGNGAKLVGDVDVSPINGRVRLGFDESIPELAGKWILLAPIRDARQRVRWLCIPVDIPAKYLPAVCRR